MKLLLDTCVWGGAVAVLRADGHDVVWSGQWTEDPGDDVILARAHAEGRVLVTLDKDFGELAIVHRRPHAGIVRLVGFGARLQAEACRLALARHAVDLTAGGIVTVEPHRVRIRPPDSVED